MSIEDTGSPFVLRGLRKAFGHRTVLDGVDLAVPRGSVVGLLGKNGAGKTTLLKCALGLLRPTGGNAFLLGEPATLLSAAAKSRLGYVPQEPTLYPWMKVRQVIRYHAAFYPHWNTGLIDELVRTWELDPEQRVGLLSVGQLQKLAILLALGNEPDLLILDEPAAALDPAARREFLRAVLNVAAAGDRTVVLSTHITSDVERVCDRVAILREGALLFDGELSDLKEQVKRLRVVSEAGLPTSFNLPGLLHAERSNGSALLTVRAAEKPLDELTANLRSQWRAEVEVEDLNLEDIFLELHHEQPA